MSAHIENYINEIKQLPIFQKLNDKELNKILINSRVSIFKKGQNIFLQDDNSLYLHFILHGAVKTFITNEDGEDAVLQIIDENSFINDFSEKKYRSNAKAIKNSTILSLSLLQLNESLNEFPQLTLNFLKELSAKYKTAVNHIGNLKLEDAKRKVGQFLLELSFKNNNQKNDNFDLKFDKASIASYLGIRSETLSRILQKLKEDGEIAIDKGNITLINNNSLCGYCNSEISEKCQDRHSNHCEYDKI